MSWLGYANEEDRSTLLENVSLCHRTQLGLVNPQFGGSSALCVE